MTDALWYLGRGSGLVSLVLLTVVVVLGVATRSGRPLLGLPRFTVAAVHRSASMLAVLFLAVHVVTLLADPYAQLDLIALVVPFTAAVQPLFYGLGALALDMLGALVVTSLLRPLIGPRTWRAVHWLAYAAWPVALVHALGSGSDVTQLWMLATTGACVAAVLLTAAWRVSDGFGPRPSRPTPRRMSPS